MAETQLTNIIIPEIFTGYTVEPSIYKSRFYRSGVLRRDPSIDALLAGGGETFNLPFVKDIAGTSGDVPSESVATTVNNLTTAKQTARRHTREKAWGANDLTRVYGGNDFLANAIAMVENYWAQAMDIIALKSIDGVIAENIANDSGDLVNDISGGTGSAAVISDNAVIDAQAKLGENGTVGRGDLNGGDFAAIVVHPATYALLRKLDLIDFVPISGQERPVSFYMGMQVIVTRNAKVNSTVYDSYIFKAGAIALGMTTQGYLPTELYRNPSKGFGINELYTRRVMAVHPVGFRWTESSVSGVTPTDAELATSGNWDRSFAAENSGVVVLRHKLA